MGAIIAGEDTVAERPGPKVFGKGRQTDFHDAAWLAERLQSGLSRPSFTPGAQRERRDPTRYRYPLIRERATLINCVQKLLEDATIKQAAVTMDIMGVSGRVMLPVAHVMLVMSYYRLRRQEPYREAGADYFDQLQPEDTARRLVTLRDTAQTIHERHALTTTGFSGQYFLW